MKWAEGVQAAWANPALNWTLANERRQESAKQLVSWLQTEDWHVFWTQTFRSRHSGFAAMARWQRFLAESNLLSILKAHTWAVEHHPNSPERHHVHALLSMSSARFLKSFLQDWRGWKERAWTELGKALILEADEKAPIHYVLKYVLKKSASANLGGCDGAGSKHPSCPEDLSSRSTTTSGASTPEKLWGVWTNGKKESRLWS